MAKMRDYAVSMRGKGPFTPVQAAEGSGVGNADVAKTLLDLLAESVRGAIVENVGVPGAEAYEYAEIKGPGAAAQHDAQESRARAKAETNGGSHGSAPVPGTAWDAKMFSPNKEVQRRIRMAANKWGKDKISKLGGGHIRIDTPIGPVTIGSTPNNSGLREDGKRLERAGLKGALN